MGVLHDCRSLQVGGLYQELLYTISRLTNIHVAKIAQCRLVDVIRYLPDKAGADCFEDNWTGEQKGRWCKADAGPGGHNDNQCTESMFSVLQDATFTRGKTTRDLRNFILALGNCMKFKSESEVKNTFPLEPVVTRDMWRHVIKMHPLTMQMATSTTKRVADMFDSWRRESEASPISSQSSVAQAAVTTTRRFERKDLNCIVIPSQGYMSLLDPKRNKTAVQLFDEMAKDRDLFIKVFCSNKSYAQTERLLNGVSLEDIL